MAQALWNGYLRVSLVSCPVYLVSATSGEARVRLDPLNGRTGNPLTQQFVDSKTGDVVSGDAVVSGCRVDDGHYIVVSDDELKGLAHGPADVIDIEQFVPRDQVGRVYLDAACYIRPEGQLAADTVGALRVAMEQSGRIGIARVVIGERERVALIEAQGPGLMLSPLQPLQPAEMPAAAAERDSGVSAEMVEIAETIIGRRAAEFDPAMLRDRSEAALRALLETKAGAAPPPAAAPPPPAPAAPPAPLPEAMSPAAAAPPEPTPAPEPAPPPEAAAEPPPATPPETPPATLEPSLPEPPPPEPPPAEPAPATLPVEAIEPPLAPPPPTEATLPAIETTLPPPPRPVATPPGHQLTQPPPMVVAPPEAEPTPPPPSASPVAVDAAGDAPGGAPRELGSEVLLHIMGLGDRRYLEAGWAGHPGSHRQIEALSIRPREDLPPSAVEFRVFAQEGRATAWVSNGNYAGTRGRGLPLTGFAVRPAPDLRDRLEIVYEGSFFEGGVVGPKRDGELCVSPVADDPLEAIRVSIVERRAG